LRVLACGQTFIDGVFSFVDSKTRRLLGFLMSSFFRVSLLYLACSQASPDLGLSTKMSWVSDLDVILNVLYSLVNFLRSLNFLFYREPVLEERLLLFLPLFFQGDIMGGLNLLSSVYLWTFSSGCMCTR